MLHRLKNSELHEVPSESSPPSRKGAVASPALARLPVGPKSTYAKVFRWRLPTGQTAEPETVEVIGSFTDWQRVPLLRENGRDSWAATLPDIAGHRTHHYMLLVDGLPAADKNCDGLAVPNGPEEEQYALATPRGPRLFMLFAQTK